MKKIGLFVFITACCFGLSAQENPFISVEGNHFIKDGQTYNFIGANVWYVMNLGSKGTVGDRKRLVKELDQLQSLGVNNLRIMASSDGPESEPMRVKPALQPAPGKLDDALLEGLDFALAELAKRDMHAVLCLNNYFMWSGGMAQYVSWATGTPIPYPSQNASWNEFMTYSARFFAEDKAKELFRDFIKKVVTRTNGVTGIKYTEDPVIMAWQLGNEPRGGSNVVEYVKWADETAAYIRSLDPNHLVSLGGEGLLPDGGRETAFETVSQSKHLDYLTMHLWIENWSWYDPKRPETYDEAIEKAEAYINEHNEIARWIGKPIVLEEFGISRDNGEFDPVATYQYRLRYFEYIFDKVYGFASQDDPLVGLNFWSWSGLQKPPRPGDYWREGDPFTGDPPHESQGWYSVYSDDQELLDLIRRYAEKMERLNEKPVLKGRR